MTDLLRYSVIPILLLLIFAMSNDLGADDGWHGKGHRHRGGSHKSLGERRGHHNNGPYSPVNNQTYKDSCGACHFAYQPWLLPSGSWGKLLSSIKDHFGQTVDIDAEPKGVIEIYLADNAAEKSHMKWARKIVRCLKGDTPLRITEVPYIRHKHRDVPPEVFKRKAVGSLSNCSACHKTADQGIYDDDYVAIPQ